MAGQLRVLRRRIKSVQSTKKITRAQELIATSRLAKAQQRVHASLPYADQMTRVLTALSAASGDLDHPLLTPRELPGRCGVLVVTSDRGFAGGYNANALRLAEELIARLRSEGKEPVLYVVGRKGTAYYRFRSRPVEASWTGCSEQPTFADAKEIARTLMAAFAAGADDDRVQVEHEGPHGPGDDLTLGVDELHMVYTRFRSMLTQLPTARRFAPMQTEEAELDESPHGPAPSYEFEPETETLLDALLPRYLATRIYSALLESAASELASRRRAMKSATDNADDLIRAYTREANQARQAEITQEISEIVGGADALASAGSES
jgi:F-type H+-transporting ATPase subunit gamma